MLCQVVFNTEAHPFMAPPAKDNYGSGKFAASTTDKFVLRPGALPAVSQVAQGSQ
jgi:mannosyl-oligosaccharide alpha-1,2-mannosidase